MHLNRGEQMGYFYSDEELAHHGIKGQKWGVRRFEKADGTLTSAGKKRYGDTSDLYNNVKTTKANVKSATESYNKAFNKAYKDSSRLTSHLSKKGRDRQTKEWEDTWNKSSAYDSAKSAHKEAKKAYKDQYKKNLEETRSKATRSDKLIYNDATRKRAAKLMTKYKDMSYEKATQASQKEAIRNTAFILSAYGAFTAYSLYRIKNL